MSCDSLPFKVISKKWVLGRACVFLLSTEVREIVPEDVGIKRKPKKENKKTCCATRELRSISCTSKSSSPLLTIHVDRIQFFPLDLEGVSDAVESYIDRFYAFFSSVRGISHLMQDVLKSPNSVF